MKFSALAAVVAACCAPALALAQATPPTPKPAVLGAIAAPTKQAPEDKSKRPSPPATVAITVGSTAVTIDYSRPSLKGREVFGDKTPLAPAGEVWRTGANEATTFTVSKAVKIEGQTLPAGTYGLFTIPGPTEWTIVFNKTAKQWGAFKYDATQDALRVKVKPKTLSAPVEQFTITADKTGKVALLWAKTEADFMVK